MQHDRAAGQGAAIWEDQACHIDRDSAEGRIAPYGQPDRLVPIAAHR